MLFQVGDRVVEVNGVTVTGKQPKEIVKLLADNCKTVTFKLVPTQEINDYANLDEVQPVDLTCSSLILNITTPNKFFDLNTTRNIFFCRIL